MRLTRKLEPPYGRVMGKYYVYTSDTRLTPSFASVEQKLGQLEDIEDELGIDLITLFKCLKNGIWVKQPSYIDLPIRKIEGEDLKLCIDSYGEVSFKELYYEEFDGTLEETGKEYELDKYGKQDYECSWAFTKEELL